MLYSEFEILKCYWNALFLFWGDVSYLAENGNLPIFMADNGKIVYISVDFGPNKSDAYVNINLEGQKTEIVNITVTDIISPRNSPPPLGVIQ